MLELGVVKVLLPWLTAFLIGLMITPYIINRLIHYKAWKKKAGNRDGMGGSGGTPIFNELHKERDVAVPRMGGLVIVISVLATIAIYWVLSFIVSGGPTGTLDFLSRNQTWLPVAAFMAGAIVGLIDDLLTINIGAKFGFKGGLPLKFRLLWAASFALLAAYWFYTKLEIDSVFVPFFGDLTLGFWYVPFFIMTFIAIFSTSNIDGLDGLSGGVMTFVFAAYGAIAYFQDQINIAAFCFVVVGGILAFTWTNIPPAKFYMTEVGYNALSFSLAIVAFATDKVLLLPVIAFCLFMTVATTIIQVGSKKLRKGKKVFMVAPIHHHFEAIGWPAHQVVMRYWIVSMIAAVLGVVLAFTA